MVSAIENEDIACISAKLLSAVSSGKFIVWYGSGRDLGVTESDIDLLIVLENDVNLLDVVVQIAPLIREAIEKYSIFVSCFPVHEKDYVSGDSQFIRNIRQNGMEFRFE